MPKLNRGNTIKLSIRMSSEARQKIEIAAKNLGISLAGVILFELTKLLENPPNLSHIEELENEITLERKHFVLTVNEAIFEKVNALSEKYDMKKNILIGYIISERFQDVVDLSEGKDTEPRKLMVQVNETLKKKMMDYSEENYIPLNALVSYSVLEGSFEGFPSYEDGETVKFFTSVPAYISDMIKEKAFEKNTREHFYTSLCIYKQFMTPEGRFFE